MSDAELNRLKWRCRRGVKELDLLFGRILSDHYPAFSEQQKVLFTQFLETPDPVIMDWVMRRSDDYPEAFAFVVDLLTQK